jgi:NTP pyrophosphatase (non-canonical NTP hydrolase)
MRNHRQKIVAEWCAAAFGSDHASSVEQRAVRLLEESIEALQAAGGSPVMAHKLVDFVFARPVGELGQELGGIGVTLLALANAAGLSADQEESKEVARVLSKPLEHFAKRNALKDAAGFNVSPKL